MAGEAHGAWRERWNTERPADGFDLGSVAAGHLRWLARGPRPTGSAEVAAARQYCQQLLTGHGYQLRERPFEYSAAVGEYGTPIGGLAALLVIFGARALSLGAQPWLALSVLLIGFLAIAAGGRWMATRGILALPIMRRRGMNLEASRGVGEPVCWLVAHVDSKSQPIPLLARAAGITVLILASVGATGCAVGALLGYSTSDGWRYVGIGSVIGALPVIASVVGKISHGAVDNASGVAAVLCAAEILPPDAAVGVLITDAEELGLAGARAWCRETTRRRAPVLNCDGVDDSGALTLMWTRPRASRLEQAFRDAVALQKEMLRVTALVPGVLVDAVAFSSVGWDAVTLSRGSLATLRRIHTKSDDLDHLRGAGIASAALILASAAMTFVERD